jgi:hypothetical protein
VRAGDRGASCRGLQRKASFRPSLLHLHTVSIIGERGAWGYLYRGGMLHVAKLVRWTAFWGHGGRNDRVEVVHEGVLAEQLRASRRMSLLVPCTQVLTDKGAVALGEIAVVDLLGIVCASQHIYTVCERNIGGRMA